MALFDAIIDVHILTIIGQFASFVFRLYYVAQTRKFKMTTLNTIWEEVSGATSPLVQPVHPLVVAYGVVRNFDGWISAKYQLSTAPCLMPASSEVRALLSHLFASWADGMQLTSFVGQMSRYWFDSAAEGVHSAVVPGLEQALKIEPLFLRHMRSWPADDCQVVSMPVQIDQAPPVENHDAPALWPVHIPAPWESFPLDLAVHRQTVSDRFPWRRMTRRLFSSEPSSVEIAS